MTGSLRLKREDTPIIAVSTALAASLAAVFWLAAHHPAIPPVASSAPPSAHGHSHPARTLPAISHQSQQTPNPHPGVVVLADRHPATTIGQAVTNPPAGRSPAPSPSAESSPTPPQVLTITPAPCLSALVINICVPAIGVTP